MKVLSLFNALLLLIAAIFTSCTRPEKEIRPERTVIAGKVENMPGDASVLVVNYCSPLGGELQDAFNLKVLGGDFVAEHDYAFPQNVTIRYAQHFINLFIQPGDSVFVHIDGNLIGSDTGQAVRFSGDNAEVNNQLFQWTHYSYSLPNPVFTEPYSPDTYIEEMSRALLVMQDTIKAYAGRNPMNEFVKQWALVDYKFILANVHYYVDRTTRWEVLTDPLFDIFNEDNFQTMMFQYHLSAAMGGFVGKEKEVAALMGEEDYAPALERLIDRYWQEVERGVVSEMMLYLYLKRILENYPELYDSIPNVRDAFSDPYYGQSLEEIIRAKGSVRKLPPATESDNLSGISFLDGDTIESLPDMEVLSFLAEKYSGKALYIDVWASWCAPCLREIEAAHNDLHPYFSDKEVVFINLCLDSAIDKWRETIDKHSISGENYYLNEDASLLFRSKYNISGFPSYILIDKAGNMIHPAHRPSALADLITQIEAVL